LSQKFITNANDFISKTCVSCLFRSHQQFQPVTQSVWVTWEKALSLCLFLLTFHFLLWFLHMFLPNWPYEIFPLITPVSGWCLWIFSIPHCPCFNHYSFIIFLVFFRSKTNYWSFHNKQIPKTSRSCIPFTSYY